MNENEPKFERVSDEEARQIDEAVRAGRIDFSNMCDHSGWIFEKHGRRCPCGAPMVDFGD